MIFRAGWLKVAIISPWKRVCVWKWCCPSYEQTWIPFTQKYSVPSLVETGPVVLEKQNIYRQMKSRTLEHAKGPWKLVWPFIWTNLNVLHQRQLCHKFGKKLKDEEDCNNILLLRWRKNQGDLTGLKENKMAARSAPYKDTARIGCIFFTLTKKQNARCLPVLYFYFCTLIQTLTNSDV